MYSERRHTVQEYLRVELGASGDVITPPPLVAARLRRFGRTTPQSAQSNSSSQSPTGRSFYFMHAYDLTLLISFFRLRLKLEASP